ncbi:MAG: hypothetical protein Q9160_008453 [Pyrenula sp. 1 TL-2023]
MLSLFTSRQVPVLPQEDVEKALSSICRISRDAKSGKIIRPSDSTFNHVAGLLVNLERHRQIDGWSLRPRTYLILRHMGYTDAMREFIDAGLKDISFPYEESSLPTQFARDIARRETFLDLQDAVLTDAVELERGEGGRHVSFAKSGNEHFLVRRDLGSGGFGSVDHVWSRLSFHNYARKRFRRQIKFGVENKRFLEMIEREISALKKVSHHHIVKVVGSYTDANYIAILMQPIASCNLRVYLTQKPDFFSRSRLVHLRTFFGCIAKALAYLHKHKIRHRDLKPENILVSVHPRSGKEQVYITDFGAAHDSSELEVSETFDRFVPFTPRYMAPEVARHAPRNSASDMWSLGVMFLEMVSVLRGASILTMRRHLQRHGTGNEHIWNNLAGAHDWFEVLRQRPGADYDNEPLAWVKDLLHNDPINRPDASSLSRVIAQSAQGIFQGHCCAGEDEDWESSVTYDEWDHLDMANEQIGNFDVAWEMDAVDPVELSETSHKSSSIEAWLANTDDVANDVSVTQTGPEKPPYEIEDETEVAPLSKSSSENSIYEIVDDDSDEDAFEVPGSAEVDVADEDLDALETGPGYEIVMDSSSDSTAKAMSTTSESSHTTAIKDEHLDMDQIIPNGIHASTKADLVRLGHQNVGETEVKVSISAANSKNANTNTTKANWLIPQEKRLTNGRVAPLTTSNVAALTMTPTDFSTFNSETPRQEEANVTSKRRKRVSRSKREHNSFSATKYMQETWEAASSIATSEMSETASRLLQQKGSLLAWQDKDMKFLERYCSQGKAAAVRILLESGCKPSRLKGRPRWRPIISAVRGASQRHIKCVRLLLEHGADVNTREPSTGRTSLHIAIAHQNFKGYTNLIAELLKHGANPNLRDKNGDFPLLQILYGGYEQLAKHRRDALACLLQPNFSTQVNVTPPGTLNMPLHLAVRRVDPWACGMLLEKGASVNSTNGSGQTPLSLAVSTWTHRESSAQIDILDLLLRHRADVNETNIVTGDTPLHIATRLGREDAIEVLLLYKASTTQMNKSETPFHVAGKKAIRHGREKHARIMRMLYEPNADESILDEHGDDHCVIVTAVEQKDCIFVQELLEYGVEANHTKKLQNTRTDEGLASSNVPAGQTKAARGQAKQPAFVVPILNIAVEGDDLSTANTLVKGGACADKEDSAGTTAFQLALNRRNTSMVELLRNRAKFERKAYQHFATSTAETPPSAWPSLNFASYQPQEDLLRKTKSFERKRGK